MRMRPEQIETLTDALKEYRKAEEQAMSQAMNKRRGQKITM